MQSDLYRFVARQQDDHVVKKLLYLYLEVVDKVGADGKLLSEMILVWFVYLGQTLRGSNMLRNDLVHPNEFVRGCCLRFVAKLKEPEILEPLIASIRQNLEHRHSYVRRNAVLAVHNIYKQSEVLMPDAPDLIEAFIATESDVSARRNAFVFLQQHALDKAVNYALSIAEQISSQGDIIQVAFLELVRKVCRANPSEKVHSHTFYS